MLAFECLALGLGRLALGPPLVADHDRPEHTQQPQASGERDRGRHDDEGLRGAQGLQAGQGSGVVRVGGHVDLLLDLAEQGVDLLVVDGQHPLGVTGIDSSEHPPDRHQVAGVVGVKALFQDLIFPAPALAHDIQGGDQIGGGLLVALPHLRAGFQTVLALQRLLGRDREASLLVGVAEAVEVVGLAGSSVGAVRRPQGKASQQQQHGRQPTGCPPGDRPSLRPLLVHAASFRCSKSWRFTIRNLR